MKGMETPGRVVGRYGSGGEGPTLIVMGALHGNEPAGLSAFAAMLGSLRRRSVPVRGELVGLSGNRRAFASDVRFLEEDLNRVWRASRIRRLRARGERRGLGPEALEQLELDDALCEIFARAPGEVCFVDVHTSSARGVPFVFIGDTLRNRKVARRFPVPVILGLEEQLDGGLTEYLCRRGCVTVGVEAGQHRERRSVEIAEGMLWLVAEAIGLIDGKDVPDRAGRTAFLEESSRGVPSTLEVSYRHGIRERKEFVMKPGFTNFQRVGRGEPLAEERGGEVRAIESGLLLLPLYQALGNDGFFLARPFGRLRLLLSVLMRLFGFDRLLPLLPGIRRARRRREVLLAAPSAVTAPALRLLYLLGYRKVRRRGGAVVLSRRPFDRRGPARIGAAS